MSINYQEIAEKTVKYARKNGADEVQVNISSGTSFSVDYRDGDVENLLEASSAGLSLKVIVNGKVANASSSDFTDESIKNLTDNAIERARYSSPDKFAKLPDNDVLANNIKDLNLYFPEINSWDARKKINLLAELEKISVADKRIKMSEGSSFHSGSGQVTIANSKGFSNSYDRSNCYYGIYLQAGSGDEIYEDGWYDSSRSYSGLLSPEQIADKAISRVTRLIGAKKIKTQKAPIIFEPGMTEFLLRFLAQCLYGSSVYMNRTFLAGKIGEKVAGSNINIIDDPLVSAGPGSQPFDNEGVASKKMYMIKNGKLENYFLNNYSALKLGLEPTGNGSGPTNFYLENGNKTQEDIIKSTDKGLLLTKTIGQGLVATTGDISRGAYGMWIENGEITYPVAEITINGNLGNILNNIEMIGNDPIDKHSTKGPTIKVAEMSISGE